MLKRSLALILVIIMSFGMLTGCGKEEPEPVPTTPEEEVKTYVYGVAGDMFREFVNLVSQGKFDEAYTYVAKDDNAIMTSYDVEQYLMSLAIGNLLHMNYSTANIILSESGSVRDCRFMYYRPGEEDYRDFTMSVKLIGNKWMVNLDEMTTRYATLILPDMNYKEIDIDGIKIDVNKYEMNSDGKRVYSLPQISKYPHPVTIINERDGEYETEITWEYKTKSNGKILDDASREILAENMIFVGEKVEEPVTENENTENTENSAEVENNQEIDNNIEQSSEVVDTTPEGELSMDVTSDPIVIVNP